MTSYLRCNEREPGISLALDIRNELTLAESARAICSFADEIRRECAELMKSAYSSGYCEGYRLKHIEPDWIDEGYDEWFRKNYAAIMGKEAGE